MSGSGYTKTVIFERRFGALKGQNPARFRAFEPVPGGEPITDPRTAPSGGGRVLGHYERAPSKQW